MMWLIEFDVNKSFSSISAARWPSKQIIIRCLLPCLLHLTFSLSSSSDCWLWALRKCLQPNFNFQGQGHVLLLKRISIHVIQKDDYDKMLMLWNSWHQIDYFEICTERNCENHSNCHLSLRTETDRKCFFSTKCRCFYPNIEPKCRIGSCRSIVRYIVIDRLRQSSVFTIVMICLVDHPPSVRNNVWPLVNS